MRLEGITILACVVLAGCGDSGDDVDLGPFTGIWNYADGGILDNTCGSEDVFRDANTSFWLTNNLDGSFTVEQSDPGPFDCTSTDGSFACPERGAGDHPVSGYDATLQYRAAITGTLPSRDRMEGVQRFDIDCEGTACGALATYFGASFPCYYTVAFTADHR